MEREGATRGDLLPARSQITAADASGKMAAVPAAQLADLPARSTSTSSPPRSIFESDSN